MSFARLSIEDFGFYFALLNDVSCHQGFVIFLAATLINVPVAAAEPIRFHFLLPTVQAGLNPHRQGSFRLEFRNAPFDQMKDLLLKCKEAGILPEFTNKPPVLYIYLPNNQVFMDHRDALATAARRQFAEVYPHLDLKIKFRVVSSNLNVTDVYSRVKILLQNFKNTFGNDPDASKYVDLLSRTNEEAFRETMSTLEITASRARRVKYSIASTRFFIIGATRTLQTLPALAHGGAPMAAALGLIVADASLEYFSVAYTQKIQRFLASFPLRNFDSRLKTQISRFVNNSLWNLILFSVGRPMVMQSVAHLSNPEIPNPSLESAANVLGWSTMGVLFYTTFTNGYNMLRDKGWVSSSQIDMALQISGMFDLATGILNSNPNWYFYRLFTWGPQWTFYALVGLLAKLAPVRADKVLAIDSSILDLQDVQEEQTTDNSWHINDDSDFDEALEHLRSSHCSEILMKPKPD